MYYYLNLDQFIFCNNVWKGYFLGKEFFFIDIFLVLILVIIFSSSLNVRMRIVFVRNQLPNSDTCSG